jgi:hypothetical protein
MSVLLVSALSSIAVALGGWLSARAASLIKAKTNNARTQELFLRLNDAVAIAVRDVQHAMVDQLKANAADGKLSAAAAENAKKAAIGVVKDHLGVVGLCDLARALDVAGPWVLDSVLASRIEAEVLKLKESRAGR